MAIKKYIDGSRFIPSEVFVLEQPHPYRASSRLAQKKKKHSLQLINNEREKNLAAAIMRSLWNALDEEMVRSSERNFKKQIQDGSIFDMVCKRGVVNVLCDL